MSTGKLELALSDPRKRASLERRMAAKIKKGEPDECWPWTKSVNADGYGRINAGRGFTFKAHRVAYALEHGPICDAVKVCHSCDNPPCCNPGHHFLGSQADNIRDCQHKGRGARPPILRGASHPNTKFGADTAARIALDKRPARLVAREHGVSQKTVYRLRWGQTWKGLGPQT